MQSDRIRFGRFRFDPVVGLLTRDGEPIPLGRRAERILAALLSQRGTVVPKAELIDAAWPDETVEESNLSVQVSQLRRLIGSHWILTIERVGYRFIVEQGASPPPDAPSIGLPAVVVIPFADLSTEGDYSRLAGGIVEDLTTALARFKSLTITSRNAIVRYDGPTNDIRRVAQDLGVRYVVEGSIRRSAGRLKTNTRLIDAMTGSHLWAETYDSRPDEPIVEAMAAAIEARVHAAEIKRSQRERPESQEAYDLYLRARFRIQSSRADDNLVAVQLYSRALELEPNNLLYLAGTAEALHHRRAVGWASLTSDDQGKLRELSRRALDQSDTDASSFGLIGNALWTADEMDLGGALTERAASMNRNSPLALVCDGLSNNWGGSLDESELLYTRAASLSAGDPTQRFALAALATIHRIRENFERCLEAAKRAYAASPGITGAHWNLIVASVYLGRMADARRYLDRYRAIAPDVTLNSIRAGQMYADPARAATLLEGLRLAGLPAR